MSARYSTSGRFRLWGHRRGAVSGSRRHAVLPSSVGPTAGRSAVRELIRRAPARAESHVQTRRRQPVMRPWPARGAGSDGVPPSAIRSLLRDAPVPEVFRVGPPPTAPNDPIATPVRRQSPGGEQRPATFPAVVVAQRLNRPPSLAEQWSSPAGRRTRAGRGSARGWCVGRKWKRGRRGQRETFWDVSVAGRKPQAIVPSEKPVWRPFRSGSPVWPYTILSGHARFIILRPAPASQRNPTASRPMDWMPVRWDASATR